MRSKEIMVLSLITARWQGESQKSILIFQGLRIGNVTLPNSVDKLCDMNGAKIFREQIKDKDGK